VEVACIAEVSAPEDGSSMFLQNVGNSQLQHGASTQNSINKDLMEYSV
jgi:hypothetical protein